MQRRRSTSCGALHKCIGDLGQALLAMQWWFTVHVRCPLTPFDWSGCVVQGGNTALHMACDQGHLEVVNKLLGAGARCDAANSVSLHRVLGIRSLHRVLGVCIGYWESA
jgi:hypothetical protein